MYDFLGSRQERYKQERKESIRRDIYGGDKRKKEESKNNGSSDKVKEVCIGLAICLEE